MFCINPLISKPRLFMLIAYSKLVGKGKSKLSRKQGTFYVRVIVTRVLEILVLKKLSTVREEISCAKMNILKQHLQWHMNNLLGCKIMLTTLVELIPHLTYERTTMSTLHMYILYILYISKNFKLYQVSFMPSWSVVNQRTDYDVQHRSASNQYLFMQAHTCITHTMFVIYII